MNDELLRRRLIAVAAGPPTADWNDALHRAGRLLRRRRLKVASIAALLVVVIASAAPAFGLGGRITDFLDGEPAPEPERLLFAELNTGAPPGMAPGVIADEARGVLTRQLSDGRRYTLWVAPTQNGGFCMAYRAVGPGCSSRSLPLSWGMSRGGPTTPIIISGSVITDRATHVVLEYDDGTTMETELVWVGKPIDAGFYFLEIHEDRITDGHQLRAVVARDGEGAELARKTVPQEAFRHVPR
jgi:hypothetical protein